MICCFVRRLPQIQLQTRESLLGETVSESDVPYCDVDVAVGGGRQCNYIRIRRRRRRPWLIVDRLLMMVKMMMLWVEEASSHSYYYNTQTGRNDILFPAFWLLLLI